MVNICNKATYGFILMRQSLFFLHVYGKGVLVGDYVNLQNIPRSSVRGVARVFLMWTSTDEVGPES